MDDPLDGSPLVGSHGRGDLCHRLVVPSKSSRHLKKTTASMLQLIALGMGHCCFSGAAVLSTFASPELLLNVFRGHQGKTQRVSSLILTLTMVLNFVLSPLSGALMDAHGRKHFLVYGPAAAAALRAYISRYPTVGGYIAYRLLLMLVCMPFSSAFQAAMSDLLDNTTDKYMRITQYMESFATMIRMLILAIAGQTKSPRRGMAMSACLGGLSSLCFAFGVSETLAKEERRPMQWKVLRNPFNSLEFFKRSPELKRLAILNVGLTIPAYNGTLEMLRRKRFGWGMKESSRQALLGQAFGLVSQFGTLPMLQRFGLKATLQWSERLGALANLVNVFAVDERMVKFTVLLQSLQYGGIAFDRVLAAEARRSGAGEGEKNAAVNNLDVLPGVIMPNVYSEIYARTVHHSPATACMVCVVLQLANSEIGVPLLWPEIGAEE